MSKESRNRLTPEQKDGLERWLRKHRKAMRGWSFAMVAEAATEQLGYRVTPGNVRGTSVRFGLSSGKPVDFQAAVQRLKEQIVRLAAKVN
jgi:hypothetical protein